MLPDALRTPLLPDTVKPAPDMVIAPSDVMVPLFVSAPMVAPTEAKCIEDPANRFSSWACTVSDDANASSATAEVSPILTLPDEAVNVIAPLKLCAAAIT